MARTYPTIAPDLKPGKLATSTLVSIGRLVRAFAEIEDIVDLFICNLTEMSESKVTVILGRSAMRKKLEIAEQLARMRSDDALKIYNAIFDTAFDDALECRNTVAHGILLGVAKGGEIAFLTAPSGKVEGEAAIRIVISYHPKAIQSKAIVSEAAIPKMIEALQVQGQREERLQRPLAPHPKSQGQANARRKPPPQS